MWKVSLYSTGQGIPCESHDDNKPDEGNWERQEFQSGKNSPGYDVAVITTLFFLFMSVQELVMMEQVLVKWPAEPAQNSATSETHLLQSTENVVLTTLTIRDCMAE